MWLLSAGGTIPVFAGSKQNRAVEEGEARAAAARANVDGMEQLLRLRVRERLTSLAALLDTLGVYDDGLLVESRATAESTLAQYQVGKVSFASVLDANAGVLADEDGYLQDLAQADQIVIAGYEVSLSPVAISAGSGMGNTAMPGQGFTSATPNNSTPSGGSASDADRSTSGGM
jgi:outer membrane protein, heavy metal efflux system